MKLTAVAGLCRLGLDFADLVMLGTRQLAAAVKVAPDDLASHSQLISGLTRKVGANRSQVFVSIDVAAADVQHWRDITCCYR